ncbi:MarR family transcriptional regulator [Actinoplanes regularis]|uniref:MarR family protein n=1 Tax=Actinoplanes regularis TaxID=52697 RepID=A0A239JFJ3_9ACTN|nr:MarR family transcriptional regulator [Actinoplanes regularis]GIE92003.1 hypothetical protein Are01nite_84830 [Actinoplanes regularis]SNT04806.1 MarR family protein [Actinoplanes regularis]
MSELGAVLGLAKSSPTGLVDRSERSGLVERGPDPEDSRAVRVEAVDVQRRSDCRESLG